MVSDLRYFHAVRMPWRDEQVPEDYWPARYGPPRSDQPDTVDEDGEMVNKVEQARQVAASMR
ncbi:hypothetical protein JTZ10_21725 [Gordonia rubripertincta]|uniref:Uncharacterized protein n=1 Tax=Gordonia rubripertincta TaxID=36822 RepID=A0AAW4GAN0_GORRU|nr:hypothetical protein [Gordonia rubripertincta]MBM7280368.1 hypothetical protein [Gordonia rubripertincta]